MAFSRFPRGRRPLVAAAAATVALAGGAATAVAVGTAAHDDRSAALAGQIDPSVPKNVILLVGDGMGESEVSIARYYQGVDKPLNMDRLPFRGVATTYDLTPLDDVAAKGKENFDPDSASTATAWSTGHKTMINRLGQGNSANKATPGENFETTIEAAKKLGKWTGNVTTAEVTDATPAGPTAHMSQRSCQGPADTRKTCPTEATGAGANAHGSIAEQQVALRPDITFGAGRARYLQTLTADGTKTVVDQAKEQGFRYLTTKSEMDAVTSLGDAPGSQPLLGLFHDKEVDNNAANMVTEWKGPTAALAGADGNAATCVRTHRQDTAPQEPALSAMAKKSIDLLDAASAAHGNTGFFLQIEGASIDKRDHAANPCEQIGETLEFDKAIGLALDYQQSHRDTLVVVTADHSHSSQIVSADDGELPTGYYNTITTPAGDKLRISYGTNGGNTGTHVPPTQAPSQQHTGAAVPVMAAGPQAANVTGTIDQTDLFPLLTFQKTPSRLPGGTVTVPGPTTTVTGPTTTVPAAVKLTAGLAAPRTVGNASARKGFSLSLLASKGAKARVTVKAGRTTVAKGTVKVRANRAAALVVKTTKLRAGRAATLHVSAVVTAGREKVTRNARVSVTKR